MWPTKIDERKWFSIPNKSLGCQGRFKTYKKILNIAQSKEKSRKNFLVMNLLSFGYNIHYSLIILLFSFWERGSSPKLGPWGSPLVILDLTTDSMLMGDTRATLAMLWMAILLFGGQGIRATLRVYPGSMMRDNFWQCPVAGTGTMHNHTQAITISLFSSFYFKNKNEK